MISTEEQKRLDEELMRECRGYSERDNKPDGAYIKHGSIFFNMNKIKRLIEAGADVNTKDEYGNSLLDFSVETDSDELTILLISAGADVNSKNNGGRSPLHWAVFWNTVDIAEYLISAGANVNAKDDLGRSPLYYGVVSEEMQELLEQHGATE